MSGEIEKFEKPTLIIATALGIVHSILNFYDLIPEAVRSHPIYKIWLTLLIGAAAALIIRWLIAIPKVNSVVKALLLILAAGSAAITLFSIWFTKHLGESGNFVKNSNAKLGDSTIISHKMERQVLSNNHIIEGDNNVVGVNGDVTYEVTGPIQRKVSSNDIRLIVGSAGRPDTKLRITLPANNKEALTYAKEIMDTLYDLGYTNLSKGEISNSSQYFTSERLSIKKIVSPVPTVNIIINPQ